MAARPPEGWKDTLQHGTAVDNLGCEPLSETEEGVEVDPLVCPKRGAEMKVIAIFRISMSSGGFFDIWLSSGARHLVSIPIV